MKWLYYTFLLILILLVAAAYLYFRPVSLPPTLSDSPKAEWHVVDPGGRLRGFLPLPGPARRLVRAVHVAGAGTQPMLLEIQSGLPAWILRRMTLPGWKPVPASEWDLGWSREEVSGAIPAAGKVDGMYGWFKTAPPVTFTLKGENPFEFESFCASPASAVEGTGGDLRLDLEAFAGSSPHLRLAFPGLELKRARLGRDYADVLFQHQGRLRDVSFGRLEGEGEGKEREASLFVRYRRSDALQGRLIPDSIRRHPLIQMLDEMEVECRPEKDGEACTGRITLTF